MIWPKQKEIYWADLNPVKGSEQSGKRPVVVISGNTMNEHLPIIIICPITSNVKSFSTCTKLQKSTLNNLKTDSEVITFQVRAVSQDRLDNKIGEISDTELQDIISKLGHLLVY